MPDNVINLDARRDALSACEATDLLRLVLSNARAGCEGGELSEEDHNTLLSCLIGLASRYPAGEYTVTYRSTRDAPEPVEVLRAVLDLALVAASARVLSHEDRTDSSTQCLSAYPPARELSKRRRRVMGGRSNSTRQYPLPQLDLTLRANKLHQSAVAFR